MERLDLPPPMEDEVMTCGLSPLETAFIAVVMIVVGLVAACFTLWARA